MRFVLVSPAGEFEAVAVAESDLDGTFDAFDVDNHLWTTIHGWQCDLELIDGPIDSDELPEPLRAWNGLSEADRAAVMGRVGERESQCEWLRACLREVGGQELPLVRLRAFA